LDYGGSLHNFRIMEKVDYSLLNSRQKETFNFQKVSAILADYGYGTIKLNDDWNGADFLAQHIDGTHLKVQLKSRLTFDKKYAAKDIYISFPYKNEWYLFPHDELLETFLEKFSNKMAVSNSWKNRGAYSWNRLSKEILSLIDYYRL